MAGIKHSVISSSFFDRRLFYSKTLTQNADTGTKNMEPVIAVSFAGLFCTLRK